MTRLLPVKPLVDEANPFWCPKIPSKKFLSHIARENDAASSNDPTFAMKLSKALRDITNDSDAPEVFGTDTKPFKEPRKFLRPVKQPRGGATVPHPLKPPAAGLSTNPVPWRPSFPRNLAPHLKRKLMTPPHDVVADSEAESNYDELCGPSKRIRSTDTYDSSSFMLSDRAEALTLSADAFQTSEISIPEGLELKTRQPGLRREKRSVEQPSLNSVLETTTPDVNHLVRQLDAMFRGARLGERLSALQPTTHQEVVNYLSEQGLLTHRSLSLFRGAQIDNITMTESLDTVQGLNEGGRDALEVFGQRSDFLSLTILNLRGAPLPKYAIKFIVSLPALTGLYLDHTEIDDSCVFPLTALQSPLRSLTLSGNPSITDASLVALTFLEHLCLTDLAGTSVTMPGLRRFALALYEQRRELVLHAPVGCREYMHSLNSQYCVDYEVKFPIIAQPSQCHGLSLASIKQNLKIHSAVNKDISLRGSEAQLRSRLEDILTTREGDLRLRNYFEPYAG
ncbi:hypothetical protein M407DRAFT_18575 [Tulasnella calospora MUT 4182]|uniref:Uncharacterized protein n=1 Tax=Tulasnella calospora MUT 4182 TaxID=1051891 RepID=A0A0C3LEY3_9AGAM|nr:hypothetical protein M407DRAFT_18575 [Tulasnella calospora MUT 4182]